MRQPPSFNLTILAEAHGAENVTRRACLTLGLAGPLGVLASLALPQTTAAQSTATPASREPRLRVVLADGKTSREWTLADLKALGTESITTHVPWDPHPHEWQGVPLRRLMGAIGSNGRAMHLKALNAFEESIPWSDLEQFDPLLAWLRDGKTLAVKDKGPLLVIYPFARHPQLHDHTHTARSVWHVRELRVR